MADEDLGAFFAEIAATEESINQEQSKSLLSNVSDERNIEIVAASAAPQKVTKNSLYVEKLNDIISQPSQSISSFLQPPQVQKSSNDGKKSQKKHFRSAGGDVWLDNTLDEWPENDFRAFVGNLGKEITTEMLAKTFSHYKSFAKAKVIIGKPDVKEKGYGFVSFMDPMDCAKAIREMNDKFLGSR